MTCLEAEPLLSDLIDGELPAEVQAALESHLAACDTCAGAYRALRRTVRFVRANARTDLAPDTPGGVYSEFNRAIADPGATASPVDIIIKSLAPPAARGTEGDAP